MKAKTAILTHLPPPRRCVHFKRARAKVPLDELRFSTVLRRRPDSYRARLPRVAAVKALSMNGVEVKARSLVNYLYVDASHRNPFRWVRPAGFAEGGVDSEKYV